MAKADLTAQRLREVLHYDPETGAFTWLVTIRGAMMAGDVAGHMNGGYRSIGVDARLYRAHRLAWLYMNGRWPENHIDHIDGCRSNNAWQNLRDVDRCVNLQNRRGADKDSSSGTLGVSQHPDSPNWKAEIGAYGKRYYLGTFPSKEEAASAYLAAKKRLHKDAPAAKHAGNVAPQKLGRPIGTSGVRGVKAFGNRWRAFLHTKSGQKHIGCFDTIEQASAAYQEAKRLYESQGGVDTLALLGHAGEQMGALYADSRGAEPVRVKLSK